MICFLMNWQLGYGVCWYFPFLQSSHLCTCEPTTAPSSGRHSSDTPMLEFVAMRSVY